MTGSGSLLLADLLKPIQWPPVIPHWVQLKWEIFLGLKMPGQLAKMSLIALPFEVETASTRRQPHLESNLCQKNHARSQRAKSVPAKVLEIPESPKNASVAHCERPGLDIHARTCTQDASAIKREALIVPRVTKSIKIAPLPDTVSVVASVTLENTTSRQVAVDLDTQGPVFPSLPPGTAEDWGTTLRTFKEVCETQRGGRSTKLGQYPGNLFSSSQVDFFHPNERWSTGLLEVFASFLDRPVGTAITVGDITSPTWKDVTSDTTRILSIWLIKNEEHFVLVECHPKEKRAMLSDSLGRDQSGGRDKPQAQTICDLYQILAELPSIKSVRISSNGKLNSSHRDVSS
jgi:hypothetical protein